MILDIIVVLLNLFDMNNNKPKYDLHRKEDAFKLNEGIIILAFMVIGVIFFLAIFFLIGHCTDSGVFYNSNLY